MLIQPRDTWCESLLVIGSIPNLEGYCGSRVPLVSVFSMNIFDEDSISSKAKKKKKHLWVCFAERRVSDAFRPWFVLAALVTQNLLVQRRKAENQSSEQTRRRQHQKKKKKKKKLFPVVWFCVIFRIKKIKQTGPSFKQTCVFRCQRETQRKRVRGRLLEKRNCQVF